MRRPLIAGNWKLNLGPGAARALAAYLAQDLSARRGVDIAVFPTALSIPAVVDALAGTPIGVGVQEVAALASGALTGASSAVMAREAGCQWALTGHSERRQHFGETDQGVRAKVRAILDAGLRPIVCVGETLHQRRTGQVQAVILRQLEGALGGLDADTLLGLTLAYEPVWAIGTGVTASPEQAQQVHGMIRGWLYARYEHRVGDALRVLYGGSVKPANAHSLLAQPDIDGALVGGASLQAGAFAAIVAAATAVR